MHPFILVAGSYRVLVFTAVSVPIQPVSKGDLSIACMHCSNSQHLFQALILDTDEATRIDKAIFGSRVAVRSYGELGTVEKTTFCCLVCFDSSLGTVMSGWGCNHSQADLLVQCMKERIKGRGDSAHAILSDKIVEKSIAVNHKLDLVMLHIGMNPSKLEMTDRESE